MKIINSQASECYLQSHKRLYVRIKSWKPLEILIHEVVSAKAYILNYLYKVIKDDSISYLGTKNW